MRNGKKKSQRTHVTPHALYRLKTRVGLRENEIRDWMKRVKQYGIPYGKCNKELLTYLKILWVRYIKGCSKPAPLDYMVYGPHVYVFNQGYDTLITVLYLPKQLKGAYQEYLDRKKRFWNRTHEGKVDAERSVRSE